MNVFQAARADHPVRYKIYPLLLLQLVMRRRPRLAKNQIIYALDISRGRLFSVISSEKMQWRKGSGARIRDKEFHSTFYEDRAQMPKIK